MKVVYKKKMMEQILDAVTKADMTLRKIEHMEISLKETIQLNYELINYDLSDRFRRKKDQLFVKGDTVMGVQILTEYVEDEA